MLEMTLFYQVLDTPLGLFQLVADTTKLRYADFLNESPPANLSAGGELKCEWNPVLELAAEEITGYFAGTCRKFTVPYALNGTSFQEQVWQELTRIPYGETISYSELALRIKRPKAARAVGQANNRNPLAIIVPCHRVIGKNGELVGYASGLDKKKWLIEWEKCND